MAESINIQPKVKGNKFTAEEFNEVLNKTNTAIQELNSNTQSLTGITSGITHLDERITILESGNTITEEIIWLTGQTKPTIDADVIIGELQEGGTHYITKYKSGNNDVAIINNINDLFSSYKTIKNTTLTDAPYIVKAQGDKFICLDYSKLFRLNADLSLDETFNITESNIYDFLIQSDNTILILYNNYYVNLYKLDINGNIDQTFESTKVQFNQYYQIRGLKKQSTGKIIGFINEYDLNGNTISSYITRLNSNGSLDNTFNDFQTGEYLQGVQILNDDSIVLYDNNDQKLHKLSSEGIEDVSYSNNYYINFSGVSFDYLLDLNTPFTDGSILFINNYGNIIKVNSNGTIDNTYNTNIAAIHISDPYVNIISHNNKLIIINVNINSAPLEKKLGLEVELEIEFEFEFEIVVIAEDGSTELSIPIFGMSRGIYESNNTYLITIHEFNGKSPVYSYSQLYNSEFSPIFTTLTEKPHYALQKQLEYPIFTPNKYYIPKYYNIRNFNKIVSSRYNLEKFYIFNNDTELFEPFTLLPEPTYQISSCYSINDILFRIENNDGNYIYTIHGLNLSGTTTDIISKTQGIISDNMSFNNNTVFSIRNLDGSHGFYRNQETIDLLSGYTWTIDSNYLLYKINDNYIGIYEYNSTGEKYLIFIINVTDPLNIIPKLISDLDPTTSGLDCISIPSGAIVDFEEYGIFPGVYKNDNSEYIIRFNNDSTLYTNDIFNNESFSVLDIVDSERKILIVRGLVPNTEIQSVMLYDCDNKQYIIPQYNDPSSSLLYSTNNTMDLYNSIHELSDGTFISYQSTYAMTSSDLTTWYVTTGSIPRL